MGTQSGTDWPIDAALDDAAAGALEAAHTATFADLEWGELLRALGGRCVSELGRKQLLALRPALDEASARARSLLSAEAIDLARDGARLPALDAPDVQRLVERVRRGSTASAGELHEARRALGAAQHWARFLREHRDQAPQMALELVVPVSVGPLHEELVRCIDDDGTVADRASSELAQARRQVNQLRQQVKARLGELIHRHREALQDAYFAERDGRYVLPVRADAPYRVEGIVLGTSATGATLYIEPRELGQLGNRLKMAEAEAEHAEAVVLGQLSELLRPLADDVLRALEVCAHVDALRAIEDFARQTQARVLEWGPPGELRLLAMRHPLLCLQGIDVVPNDLSVASRRGLVLSGPNAGGKTVALKCLGLAALMQASGLPIPAANESTVGFFSEVWSDIGDDQSLAQSLSTFSGHITRVRGFLERARPGVLVLLDELAGGTDPEEGAVLAVALLEEFVRRGAALSVTTHYERLKELGNDSPDMENAAVGFDFERLEPTFRLEQGSPGASAALAVAQRHGLPRHVVERARELLPELSQRREELIRELERQRVEVATLRRELQAETEHQRVLRHELEEERRRHRELERQTLSRAGQELLSSVKEARAEVQRVRKQLGQTADRQSLRQSDKAIDEAARLVALGGQLDRQVRRPAEKAPLALRVGMRVRLAGTGAIAEVLEEPKRGQVRVLAGVMKLSVSVEQLEPLGGTQKPAARPKPQRAPSPPPVEAPLAPPRTQDVTLDLRGERVEAALDALEQFVDGLLRRGEVGGYVLHGHGTGAMKSAVREHLRSLTHVADSRPAERDEGGDAFTVFWTAGS